MTMTTQHTAKNSILHSCGAFTQKFSHSLLCLAISKFLISFTIHQSRSITRVLHFHKPSLFLWRTVHLSWLFTKHFIHFQNFALAWSINLTNSLHTLQGDHCLFLTKCIALRRQVNIYHLTKCVCGKL